MLPDDDMNLPRQLCLSHCGNRLELLLTRQGEVQLLVNGLVRARTRLGKTGAWLSSSAQIGYEDHQEITGRVRLNQPEGQVLELLAGQLLLGRRVTD